MGAIPEHSQQARALGDLFSSLSEFDAASPEDRMLAAKMLKAISPESNSAAFIVFRTWLTPVNVDATQLWENADPTGHDPNALFDEAEYRRNPAAREYCKRKFADGLDDKTFSALVEELRTLRDDHEGYERYLAIGHALRHEAYQHREAWLTYASKFRQFRRNEFDDKWNKDFTESPPRHLLLSLLSDRIGKSQISVQSVGEILTQDFTQNRFLIDNILVRDLACLVLANKKCMKSNLMFHMGFELSYGGTFLGHNCIETKVMYFSGETRAPEFQDLIRSMIAASPNLTAEQIEKIQNNFRFSEDLPRVGGNWKPYQDAIREHGAGVCMIDPSYMVMPTEGASVLQSQGKALKEIDTRCLDAGAQLVLAAHTKKGVEEHPTKPVELGDVAWAGYDAWAPSYLTIRRKEKYKHNGVHPLLLSIGGRSNHGGLYHTTITNLDADGNPFWNVDTRSNRDVQAEVGEEAEARRINEAVEKLLGNLKSEAGVSFTHSKLREFAGCTKDKDLFEKVLTCCRDDGTLTEIKRKGNGRHFVFKPAEGGE